MNNTHKPMYIVPTFGQHRYCRYDRHGPWLGAPMLLGGDRCGLIHVLHRNVTSAIIHTRSYFSLRKTLKSFLAWQQATSGKVYTLVFGHPSTCLWSETRFPVGKYIWNIYYDETHPWWPQVTQVSASHVLTWGHRYCYSDPGAVQVKYVSILVPSRHPGDSSIHAELWPSLNDYITILLSPRHPCQVHTSWSQGIVGYFFRYTLYLPVLPNVNGTLM